MSVNIFCESCNKDIKISDDFYSKHQGKIGKCPHCKNEIPITESHPENAPEPILEAESIPSAPETQSPATTKKYTKNSPFTQSRTKRFLAKSETFVDPKDLSTFRALISKPDKKGWIKTLIIFAVSLILFLGASFLYDWKSIGFIIIIILIHELGHAIGMKLFGYKNLKIFFIPFFGAAASGEKSDAPIHHQAIISLLGPLPGLIIGVALFLIPSLSAVPLIRKFAFLMIVINAFNLLPFKPLDGGRFLDEVIFSRHIVLEIGFQAICAICLFLAGYLMEDKIFFWLGIFSIFSLSDIYKTYKVTSKIKASGFEASVPLEQLDDSKLFEAIKHLKRIYPNISKPAQIVDKLKQVFGRMQTKKASLGWTISLLFIYIFSVVSVIITGAVIFEKSQNEHSQINQHHAAVENLRLGYQSLQMGLYDAALTEYNEAIKKAPDYAFLYAMRGFVYYKKGLLDSAMSDYEKAIKLDPETAYAYNNRGLLYKDTDKIDLAFADFNKAIELDQYLEEAYNNRGTIFELKGEHNKAISDFDKAIEFLPDYAEAYNNRGVSYMMIDELDKAMVNFQEALNRNPNYQEAADNMEKVIILQVKKR